jgi:hypothetical protein
MQPTVKRPRGRPSTDKNKIIKPTAPSMPNPPTETKYGMKTVQRGRPTNKNIITQTAAQPETTKPRGRPSNKDNVKPKAAIIDKPPKLNKSKPIDIPHIKELARDDEKK